MTREKINIVIMALAAVLLAGCADETREGAAERVPVSFWSGIARSSTRTTTRDNVWSGSEHIMITDGVTIKTYKPASEGTSVALEAIDSDNILYWPIDKGSRTFEAWYPANGGSKPTVWTVATDQNALADASTFDDYDLLYATSGVVSNGSTVTLDFYHQMAHVIVYIRGLAWTGQEISSITFGSNNVAVTGTVAMGTTGIPSASVNWTVSSGDKTNTVTLRNQANTLTYECLLPPQTGGSSSTTLLAFHTKTDQAYYEANRTSSEGSWEPVMANKTYHYNAPIDLEAGKEYSFFIRLERVGLSVASMITDWDSNVSEQEVEAIYQSITLGGSVSDWDADVSNVESDAALDFTYTK
ncbi:MAG: fimbrillin family protein [Prevotella sp.]|nr:fimbrillin family protein [Prevotella sp.]